MSIIGYFQQMNNPNSPSSEYIPKNANLVIAFSGWADPLKALTACSEYPFFPASVKDNIYIAFGGVSSDFTNNNGTDYLKTITDYINADKQGKSGGPLSAYKGILFDIEHIDASVTDPNLFQAVFAAAKNQGFKVIVSVSHTGINWDTSDIIMKNFLTNSQNIDYFAPQLYSTGNENPPDFSTLSGSTITWSDWVPVQNKILPAIPWEQQFSDVVTSFKTNLSITIAKTSGFLAWNNGPTGGFAQGSVSPFPQTTTKTKKTKKSKKHNKRRYLNNLTKVRA
jgi:hypothetical protein